MPDRKPFDPSNSYDRACETVRRSVVAAATEAPAPQDLDTRNIRFAQLHGTTMALACLVAALAVPSDREHLLGNLISQLPTMLEDAIMMIEGGGDGARAH